MSDTKKSQGSADVTTVTAIFPTGSALSWSNVNEPLEERHDNQQNDIRHNNIQDYGTQHNDVQHNDKNMTLSIMAFKA
jgi:hypothetical protein